MRALFFLLLLMVTGSVQAEVIGVWFSPNGGAEAAICEQIDQAEHSVDYQMFSFTSAKIADALIRAHKRGLFVTLLLDADANSSKTTSSQAQRCIDAGLLVFFDDAHNIAHNKTRIFDGRLVMLGSYNDSDSAEKRNAETLVLLNDKEFVRKCIDNFYAHTKHSRKRIKKP